MKNKCILLVLLFLLSLATVQAGAVFVLDDDEDFDYAAGPDVVTWQISIGHDNAFWGAEWDSFNDTMAYNGSGVDFDGGTSGPGTATYTFDASRGVVAGTEYNVYGYWRQQGNTGPATYSCSDGALAGGLIDMTLAATPDIMILDPDPSANNNGVTHFGFQLLGTVIEDGDGVIDVILTADGANFINVDAVAIESIRDETAKNPTPTGAELEPVTTTELTWEAPTAYDPEGYDLVFRAATEAIEPNFLGSNDLEITGGATGTGAASPETVTLTYGTTYYWRVDAYEPNLVGTKDPIRREGDVWSFTTPPHGSTYEIPFTLVPGIVIGNPSFEEAGAWQVPIPVWYDNGDAWNENVENMTIFGTNFATVADNGTIWQPIGTWTANTDYDVVWGVTKRPGRADDGIIASLWYADPALLPADQAGGDANTPAGIGATLIAETALYTSGVDNQMVIVSETLNTGTAANSGDVLILQFINDPATTPGDERGHFDLPGVGNLRAGNSAWGGINVGDDPLQSIELQWNQGVIPTSNYALDPTVTGYEVFFGPDPDPAVLPSAGTTTGAGSTSLTVNTGGSLLGLTTYYFRVDEATTGGTVTGPTWEFVTGPLDPILLTDPAPVTEATTAAFTVTADASVTGFYDWKHNGISVMGPVADGATQTSGDYTVTNTTSGVSTLEIANLELADEGTVSCVISNADSPVTVESAEARLMTARLVAHWELDGDLTAIETNVAENWDGVYIDPNDDLPIPPVVYTTGADGLANGAVKFNGHNLVEVPDSNEFFDFHPQGLTLTAWVLGPSSGDWKRPFNKVSYGIIQQDSNSIGLNIEGTPGWQYSVPAAEGSEGKWRFVAVTYGGSNDPNRVTYGVYDDDDVIDVLHSGVVTQTGTITSGINVLIGGAQVGTANPSYNYDGSVDDVRVYNYALTASQIQGVYTEMLPTTPLCTEFPAMDTTGPDGFPDCKVDLYEFAEIALAWLECGLTPVDFCSN